MFLEAKLKVVKGCASLNELNWHVHKNIIFYDYDFNNRIWIIVNDSMQIKILG